MQYFRAVFLIFFVFAGATYACPWLDSDGVREIIKKNEFNKDRDYPSYVTYLRERYRNALLKLNANSHYLDLGAGNAKNARQVAGAEEAPFLGLRGDVFIAKMRVKPESLPQVTAVSLIGADVEPHPKFQYLKTRFFEDIPDEEITGKFGLVDLITDFFGVIAYTDRLIEAISKIYRICKEGAQIMIYLGSSDRTTDLTVLSSAREGKLVGMPRRSTLYHSVVMVNGEPMLLPVWIQTLPHFKTEWSFDSDYGDIMILTKIKTDEPFPNVEFIKSEKTGMLPYPRLFKQID